MARAQKEIQLPLWMKTQAEMYARERLKIIGIKESDPRYKDEFNQSIQDFAEESYQHSLTSGTRKG